MYRPNPVLVQKPKQQKFTPDAFYDDVVFTIYCKHTLVIVFNIKLFVFVSV